MNRLEKLSTYFFSSDPNIGKIGSIDLDIWLAQLSGIPILGLRKESLTEKAILYIYGILMVTIVTFCYTGFEVYDLILHWNDLDAFTQNFCLSLTHVAGILKIINMFYRLSDVHKVIETLKFVTRKYIVSFEQHQAFFRGEFENKMPLMIYGSMVASTGILGFGVLLYNPESVAGQIFPYRVKLPTWLPYQLKQFYMGISVLTFALQIVAIDYLNVTLMNHIRFQLNILNLTFDELTLTVEDKTSKEKHAKLDNPIEKLNSIIEHHCTLIKLRDQVENIFRIPVLIQFFTSLVIFAVTGFQATVRSGGSNGDLLIYLYCGCIFCELFVYCWFGNEVFEQSKTLTTNGYSASWYQFDPRFNKTFLIFLTNAQRPFSFTAGGFMGLSLPSFAGILSKSYSFIAVLRQIYAR